jgi:hypothetical protein
MTAGKSNAQSSKKASNKGKKGNHTESTIRVPKKACTKNIATSARSMGACILCTIQETVVSIRKTEQKNLISALPRKVERNPIPQSSLSCNSARHWTSLRRQSRNRAPSPRNAVGMIAIPTLNRELSCIA